MVVASCGDPSGPTGPPDTLAFEDRPNTIRQGDLTVLAIRAFDHDGSAIEPALLVRSIEPFGAGEFVAGGAFVGYQPGEARLIATHGALADTIDVTIRERGLSGTMSVVGRGFQGRAWNTDLWVHGNYAYTGTFSRGPDRGDDMLVWDVSDPAAPVQIAAVTVDASLTNDIKLRPDGKVAVITHEGSGDGLNGISLVNLQVAGDPVVITRFVHGLAQGVHNAWFEGRYLYLAVNNQGGLHILDVSNPVLPFPVAQFHAGTSFVHDVYVRDGLAFVSHWDAGLIILDVGNGIVGGSPTNPVEVSRLAIPGVKVHNAWYWPARKYVLIGDEVRRPGLMYVIDVSDMRDPVLLAEYRTPNTSATPHNFWVDEARDILWLAWYSDGLYAVDATGPLAGRLDLQGRTILQYRGWSTTRRGCFDIISRSACAWAPQLHNGLIYLSDVNNGLVILQPNF